MPIGSVIQRGGFICVYDERGRQLCMITGGGTGPGDGLQGYTGSTISVRRAGYICIYNEKGQQVSMVPVGS